MPASIIGFDIEGPELRARDEAQLRREALRATAMHHRRHTMGKHFQDVPETQPGGEYGYLARSPGYVRRKMATYGHNIPWRRTGYSARYIYSNSIVRGTQYSASLDIKAPFPLREQARRELEAMTDRERNDSRDFAGRHYLKEAVKPQYQRTRKRRIQ